MMHKLIDGRLLNLDKKWHHLSKKQQEFIRQLLREKYMELCNTGLNMKDINKQVLSFVQKEIARRGIWLPYTELKKVYSSCKDKVNRQTKKN